MVWGHVWQFTVPYITVKDLNGMFLIVDTPIREPLSQ